MDEKDLNENEEKLTDVNNDSVGFGSLTLSNEIE